MRFLELVERMLRSGIFLDIEPKDAGRHNAVVTQLVVHLDDGRPPVETQVRKAGGNRDQ